MVEIEIQGTAVYPFSIPDYQRWLVVSGDVGGLTLLASWVPTKYLQDITTLIEDDVDGTA
jgi:hypothetical protein